MRENIVRNYQVCAKPLLDQFPGQAAPKKLIDGGDSGLLRHLGNIHRGFDAEGRYFSTYKLLQQVTVVAGNFDDLALLIKLVLVADLLDVSLRVLHPGIREG